MTGCTESRSNIGSGPTSSPETWNMNLCTRRVLHLDPFPRLLNEAKNEWKPLAEMFEVSSQWNMSSVCGSWKSSVRHRKGDSLRAPICLSISCLSPFAQLLLVVGFNALFEVPNLNMFSSLQQTFEYANLIWLDQLYRSHLDPSCRHKIIGALSQPSAN